MKVNDNLTRYPCLFVLIGMMITFFAFMFIGIFTYRLVDPETYIGAFIWLFTWLFTNCAALMIIWTVFPKLCNWIKSRNDYED